MMTVQRQVGKLLHRSADASQVSVLLNDFEEADKMLDKLIDATKAWRDGWVAILDRQLRLVTEFENMYSPIIGSSEPDGGINHVVTPEETMERTIHLRAMFEECRSDMLDEINLIDARIVQPAMEAKDSIQPMKKVIKKREDKKLDYERYHSRVESVKKKQKMSERDFTALAKYERDLDQATQAYTAADDHLKNALPALINITFSILPHLLSSQILIQNTLLGQSYTVLYNFCQEEGLPSQPALREEIISDWECSFRPVQKDIETGIGIVAAGKAVRQPMGRQEKVDRARENIAGRLGNGAGQRRSSSQLVTKQITAPPARESGSQPLAAIMAAPSRTHSSSSISINRSPSSLSSKSSTIPRENSRTPSAGALQLPVTTQADYLNRGRLSPGPSTALAAVASKKKKPPPPPPKKPKNIGLWVTALYDFGGQSEGDLSFKEGDKIRVVNKTDSTDDWWEGELRGMKGAFPANYCQVG